MYVANTAPALAFDYLLIIVIWPAETLKHFRVVSCIVEDISNILDPFLLSICTGILGTFDILQFEISSLMNWFFFLVWKQTGYFYHFKLEFFPSFWARVKYFDEPCLTIYSLFTIYRDKHYQFLVWWIHYTYCCESKKLKPGKFHLCSLWNDIFNYPN